MIQKLQKAIDEIEQAQNTLRDIGGVHVTREISLCYEILEALEGAAKFIRNRDDVKDLTERT